MNAHSAAAALAVAAAATSIAFAAQTQRQPSPESHFAPNAAYSSYEHQGSANLAPDRDLGATPDAASCQLKREALKDAAASTVFASTAAQDGMVEVALAGLVFRKSNDNQLREFALKVVRDYAESNGGLDSIVKCEGLILPVELDAKHVAVIKRLNAKSGRAFENAYLKHLTPKHSEAMAMLEAASVSGDSDLSAFARKGLSMLREHRLLADDLRVAIGTKVVNTR